VANYLHQQKREAIAANDATEVWSIAESLTVVQKLQRTLHEDFMALRKDLLRKVKGKCADAA
jgi:hypothetical protein